MRFWNLSSMSQLTKIQTRVPKDSDLIMLQLLHEPEAAPKSGHYEMQ